MITHKLSGKWKTATLVVSASSLDHAQEGQPRSRFAHGSSRTSADSSFRQWQRSDRPLLAKSLAMAQRAAALCPPAARAPASPTTPWRCLHEGNMGTNLQPVSPPACQVLGLPIKRAVNGNDPLLQKKSNFSVTLSWKPRIYLLKSYQTPPMPPAARPADQA